MISSVVIFAFICSLLFKSAISATINYEPIKITVNENFNAQPSQVSPELEALKPGFLHQRANFYFKPQLNLPQSFIPSHIEALISLLQQHHHSCTKDASKVVVEKDKLIQILKPFIYPLSDISTKTLSEIVLEKGNDLELVKPPEINSPAIQEIVAEPATITEEPKSVTPELLVIPEAPVLPTLYFNRIPSIVEEEVKKEESIVFEEPTEGVRPIEEPIINYVEPKPTFTEFQEGLEAPELPPLSPNDIQLLEQGVKIEESLPVDTESKPATPELFLIPEPPVLPPLSINGIPSVVKEEVKNEELVKLQEATAEFSTIPDTAVRPVKDLISDYVETKPIITEFQVIPKAPELRSPSENGITLVEEGMKIDEPIIMVVEPNPTIQELAVIPEAPVLPPLLLHDVFSFVEETLKKGESVILAEPTSVFSTILEIALRSIQEPITNYVEPNFVTSELGIIPDVPVLPPLPFNSMPSLIEEEVKTEESIIFGEPTSAFPEIALRPIEEPITNYEKPKLVITEFQVIPEAPVLPPPSANDIKLVEEGVKFEEPIAVAVESKPIMTDFQVIPEAPVLPPLSANDITLIEERMKIEEPIIVDVEPKPAFQNLVLIPEAPVLPLSSDMSVVGDEKLEETITIEESTDSSSIPEISVRPKGLEPAIIDVEPKPITSNQIVIPEAPVLPALKFNGIFPVDEEVKKRIKVEGTRGVFPSIPKISPSPIPESITVSETKESFALKNSIFPVSTEELKIEIPILLVESIEVFPPTADISSGQTLEPIQERKMTNSYVLKEVSQPNAEQVVTVKETLPPRTITKPSNNLGAFSYAPFVSHLSNRAPKMKKLRIGKPASLERFLLKKHPFRLPVTPCPKLPLNGMKSPIWENKNQFLYPTSYAHDVVEKRIVPNIAFKKYAPPKRVKIYIRTQVPKVSSY